jgi:uncharacterized membrane protein
MAKKKRKKSKLKRYFLTGILITAPVGLTLYLTWLFITWVDLLVSPLLPDWLNPTRSSSYAFPGIGLIVTIMALTVVGWLMAGFLGNWFTRVTELILIRVPVVKTMYMVIKQVLETTLTDQSKAFKKAVMVEFPRKGSWVLAFATSRERVAIDEATGGGKMVGVFVPTTPNLTSGYLIFVDESDVKEIKMSAEEALKLIISGGIVATEQVIEKK